MPFCLVSGIPAAQIVGFQIFALKGPGTGRSRRLQRGRAAGRSVNLTARRLASVPAGRRVKQKVRAAS
jgi:hypothetical protein